MPWGSNVRRTVRLRGTGLLVRAGAAIVDVKIATYDQWNEPELEVLLYEFKDGLNTYLKMIVKMSICDNGFSKLHAQPRIDFL